MVRFKRFFSIDSAKAVKAQSYGWLNAINYMAPAGTAGVGNLCPHASPGCLAICLGWHSGHAAMVAKGKRLNAVRRSRIAKAKMFMSDRTAFMSEAIAAIKRAQITARNKGLKLCVRLNGATDIGWEGIRLADEYAAGNIFDLFPDIQFVDYTKNKRRALNFAGAKMPTNYHLTFSRSETNEADCLEVLAAGGQVAVVSSLTRPDNWNGYPTIDGDAHDLRHLNPRGHVVWLSPKGRKAMADKSGFVLR